MGGAGNMSKSIQKQYHCDASSNKFNLNFTQVVGLMIVAIIHHVSKGPPSNRQQLVLCVSSPRFIKSRAINMGTI